MEAPQKSERFLDRIFEIPLISTSYNKATDLYSKTKNSNSFMESTFNMVENLTKTAIQSAQPIRQALDGPIVYANKVACQQLTKLEEKYPDVKLTPDEIVDRSKNYYENSSLKQSVDKTVAVKDFALEKVKDSRQSLLTFVDESLKFSESLVKARLSTPNSPPSTSSANVDDTYFNRLRHMTSSVSDGILYRLNQYKQNFEKGENRVKNATTNLHQILSIDFAALKKRSQDAMGRFHQITTNYESNSEKLLLNFVHRFAQSIITVSDILVNFSKPYLNESTEKLLYGAASYIKDVNQAFTETQSLKEVKEKSVEEAKSGFEYVWSRFTYLASSFSSSSNNKELHLKSE